MSDLRGFMIENVSRFNWKFSRIGLPVTDLHKSMHERNPIKIGMNLFSIAWKTAMLNYSPKDIFFIAKTFLHHIKLDHKSISAR